ncbi:MAG: translation initiation factor IF-2 [Pseudonocardia sp.]|nr:translation initiation factor IF-2 [Pseudonocardia sp.]
MTATNTRRRRARRDDPAAARLAELTAARDRLDADQAERRRREDAALAAYAAAAGEVEDVVAARDRSLADLDRQREKVHTGADQQLAEIQARQSAVLAELTELGRPAEDLAVLVDIPVKRVRVLLREHRDRVVADTAPAAAPATSTAPAAAASVTTAGASPDAMATEPGSGAAGTGD